MKNTKLIFLAVLAMLLGTVMDGHAAPDPNFHIYLCFGQSNMEGQGNIESQDRTVDSRFQVLCSYDNCGSRKRGGWYDATPPLSCCSGQHLGPVDYFGRTLVKNLPEKIKVGVVVVAIAGCDIQLFEKENYKSYRAESYMQSTIQSYGGNPYGRLVEMGKEAQKVGVIKGILLHQGETNTGQSNWPSRVKAVYNDLLNDLGLKSADVPLLVGEVVRSDQGGQCGGMNSIIANVPSTIPNSYVISAQGLGHKGDNLHFSSASYRTLGERYAEQMLKVLKYDEGQGGEQGGGSSSNCVDPCSMKTKYSGGKSVSGNVRQEVGNGYHVEQWRDGGGGDLTVFGGKADCAFKASWSNSGDYLARVGYYDGSNSKKYTDLGEIHAVYNYTKSGNGGGSYSYIGIYGWTRSPLIEYYIVEDSFTPNGGGMFWDQSRNGQAATKGTYTVDGVTYTLKVGKRINQPSIDGTSTFDQVFAIRSSYQTCGHVNVTEHFKNWEKLGVKLGGIYDCKLLCEVGGGSGSVEYTCASMSWKGQNSSLGDLSCSEGGSQGGGGSTEVVQKPYKEAFVIPGLVEAENYDVGGNGNAYYDSDDTNEGDAKYRTDEGVDIVKGGTGNAVGYTTSSEWLEYTIDVKKTSKYDVVASASNGSGDISMDLYVDDQKVATLSGAQTGNNKWDVYENLTATTTEIKSGKHILKVKFGSNNNNLDYIKLSEPDTTSQGEQGGGSHGGGGSSNEAGVYPLSYSVENTGADCAEPSSLNKNNLKSCRTLPNPFEWADGSGKVTDFCDWSCRRNEIKREIEFWEIGEKPKFDKLEASYSGGTLTVKVYNGSNTLTLTSKISVPSGNGPHPIVIGMDGNTGSLSSSYFSKCIQVPFTHSQIANYNGGFDGSGRSQNDPFYKLYPNTFNTKADYCAWSWGISRLIDGLEIVKDQIKADLGHIAVTGCSYAGKMALYAGAFDERVALTIAQESGGGGINAWRVSSEIGSDVEGISNTNYDWFLNSFKSNFQSQIDKLPYDHHELIAMIAPRAFLAFGNPDYTWLGDAAGYASLLAAEEVWKSMGIEDRFGYVIEGGHSHCQASNNQNKAAQAFINKFLYGDDSQNTKVRTSSVTKVYNSGKYDWGGHKIVNNGCGGAGLSELIDLSEESEKNQLSQNRPNPANGETTIDFSLTQNAFVTIDLYNSIGVKVMNIASDNYSAGSHSLTFSVDKLPQGIYFYVMNANGFVESKSMIVK